MPYTLVQTKADSFLDIKISVEVQKGQELEEALQRWREVAELCRKHDTENILAEMEFNTTLDMQNTFQLVTAAPRIGWKKSYNLAILLNDDQSYLGMLFAETAMNNLGYSMKLFRQRRKARKWLLYQEA